MQYATEILTALVDLSTPVVVDGAAAGWWLGSKYKFHLPNLLRYPRVHLGGTRGFDGGASRLCVLSLAALFVHAIHVPNCSQILALPCSLFLPFGSASPSLSCQVVHQILHISWIVPSGFVCTLTPRSRHALPCTHTHTHTHPFVICLARSTIST